MVPRQDDPTRPSYEFELADPDTGELWVDDGAASDRNFFVLLALGILFGVLGVHRFYVGKIWTGLALLFTGGGFGIWWIVDCVMIALGTFRDCDGRRVLPPGRD